MGTFGFAEVEGSSRVRVWDGESVEVAGFLGGGGPMDEIGFAELEGSSRLRVCIWGSVEVVGFFEGGGPMAVSIWCRMPETEGEIPRALHVLERSTGEKIREKSIL